MNMNITKHKEEYVVEKDGKQLAKIETYRNPYHFSNCYIKFDSDSIVGIGDTNIFQIIADEEKSPLQAIAVVNEVFKDNQSIVFEADDVDWAAMGLKNLFLTDSTETFDTWIYKK